MICQKCKTQIEEKFNYCPCCSLPLNQTSEKIKEVEKKNHQMEIILKIVPLIKDSQDMAVLKKIVESLTVN